MNINSLSILHLSSAPVDFRTHETAALRESASGQPAAWRKLAVTDERADVLETLLRFTLMLVLVSTAVAGVLL